MNRIHLSFYTGFLSRLCLILYASALIADDAFLPNMDRQKIELDTTESWHENSTQLPPLPIQKDLIELNIDNSTSPFRYFIDTKHLLIGADGVVRYSIVIESHSGSRNFAYEGIRCTPKGQYKVFAYGASDQFIALHTTEWQPILNIDAERYRYDLWQFYFCVPSEFKPRIQSDILRSFTMKQR